MSVPPPTCTCQVEAAKSAAVPGLKKHRWSSTNHASLCILGEANPQEESGLKMQRALDKDLVCTGICENRLTATWWDHC